MNKITPQMITYGLHDTVFGQAVIARTVKGICWLGYMTTREQGAYKGDGFERMHKHFPKADFTRDDEATVDLMSDVMRAWKEDTIKELPYDLNGTDFECSVWNALLDIPCGTVVSYGEVANDIGKPKATRAVGTAVGNNPVSLVIPCHRVVRADGSLGNYGWGLELKEKMLKAEGALNTLPV